MSDPPFQHYGIHKTNHICLLHDSIHRNVHTISPLEVLFNPSRTCYSACHGHGGQLELSL